MSKESRLAEVTAAEASTFASLGVGACFKFADGPHELGWPDGPWRKTGADTVTHMDNGSDATVDDVNRPTTPYWTDATVRAELPKVKVEMRRRVYDGRTYGRKSAFATVRWGADFTAEWSWSAIVRSLNTGKPLLV